MTSLTLTLPDDWHIHLRDGAALSTTVPDVARWAGRAIVMPNLTPPVLSVADALAYRDRILAEVPEGYAFEPLMTLYLTDQTTSATIAEAAASPHVHGIKLYPAGATTNSASGVTALEPLYPIFEAMEMHDVPLLIHGEVTDSHCDIFDREKAFIELALIPLVERFPALRIVFEHITTGDAVQFIENASQNVAATVTAHHLLYNRNHLLVGGVKPHLFCLPVLKRDQHQLALRAAVTSGNSRFFWVPTQHRIPVRTRNPAVVARAVTPRMRPSNSMQKCLMRRVPWIDWKLSPASTDPTFTDCHAIPRPSHSPSKRSLSQRKSLSTGALLCRFEREKKWAGL